METNCCQLKFTASNNDCYICTSTFTFRNTFVVFIVSNIAKRCYSKYVTGWKSDIMQSWLSVSQQVNLMVDSAFIHFFSDDVGVKLRKKVTSTTYQ